MIYLSKLNMEEIKFILSTVQPNTTKITQRLITSSEINRVSFGYKEPYELYMAGNFKNKNKSFVF